MSISSLFSCKDLQKRIKFNWDSTTERLVLLQQLEDASLDEIETLLNQSIRGIHALFDNQTIAGILKNPTEELDFFNFTNLDRIQSLFSQFMECSTSADRKRFLQKLEPEDYEIIVRTYFHIVDNSVLANSTFRH